MGQHLVRTLAERGHEVIALAGRRLSAVHGAAPISLDLADRAAVSRLPAADVIVHAATARPSPAPAGLEQMIRSNVMGTLNVLEHARETGVQRLIYCSTLSVYALPQAVPIQEDGRTYPVGGSDAHYAISKLAGELLCEQFRVGGAFECLSLRLARIYGPGETGGLLLEWMERARKGHDIVVFGDGGRSLDFLYIADAVRAIALAVESSASGVINVGTGEETTWRTLAATIAQVFAPSSGRAQIRYVGQAAATRCYLDTRRAESALGFRAEYSLADGLAVLRDSVVPV